MKRLIAGLLVLINLVTACVYHIGSDKVTGTSPYADPIELIIFTADNPAPGRLPEIHIWKDNHAMWVNWKEYEKDKSKYYVYETNLSPDEINSVKKVLNDYGYWEDQGGGAIGIGSSEYTIWTDYRGHEQSVVFPYGMNIQPNSIIPNLIKILENSKVMTEYTPYEAYLFASTEDYYSTGIFWPDDLVPFDFSRAENGAYITGEVLQKIWEVERNSESWIISNDISYFFSLYIPGLSCIVKHDGIKNVCTMYTIGAELY